MKPIKLTIKGLNSFIEQQTVDFEKLTDRGFFGIFGPTGSGKSTILDGITLALYGDVARKSSNYINTNVDAANVSFEFQISGVEEKRYIVTREFKRDKKSGNTISGKCKLVDMSNGTEEVIADKVKEVTNNCKEIIGLSLEDFTRTVVLPQGKFSEFLKLEGKSRREMLERLFNLQQYGDNLSRKLSREINKEKTENSVLIGQLMGYEDISEEAKKEKEEAQKENEEALKNAKSELVDIEKSFKENAELWNLQLEVESYKNKEKELMDISEEIELDKNKVKLGEAAEKVNPYILTYNETLNNIEATEKNLSISKENLEVLKVEKEKAEEAYTAARNKKDNELPKLRLQEQKVNDALEDKKALDILNNEIISLENKVKILQEQEKKHNEEAKELEVRVEKGSGMIISTEKEFEELKLDNEIKGKVQKGLLITNEFENLIVSLKKAKDKVDSIEKDILVEEKNKETLIINLTQKEKELVEKEKAYNELIKNCPGNQEDLLRVQNQYATNKEKWNEFNRCTSEITRYKEYITSASEILKVHNENKDNIEKLIGKLKADLKECETENLAHSLREALSNGGICPVCGSIDHHKENIKVVQLQDVKELENKIVIKEQELRGLENNIIKIQTNIETSNINIKELNNQIEVLGNEFKKASVEELKAKVNEFAKKLTDYTTNKEALEKSNKILKDENHELETKLKAVETKVSEATKQLTQLKAEYRTSKEELQKVVEKLNTLKVETNVEDFKVKNNEIIEIEKKRNVLEDDLKKYRNHLEKLIKEKENHQTQMVSIKETLAKEKSTLEVKNSNKLEKIEQIKSKAGEVDNLEELLNSIVKNIKAIEVQFELCEKNKEVKDKAHQECNEKIIRLSTSINELEKRKVTEKENLDEALRVQNFESVEYAINSIIDEIAIKKLKDKIEKYNEELSKVRGAIESVTKKINGRDLTEEEWAKLQEEKVVKENVVESLSEVNIKIIEELRVIKEKILELKDLLKKKEALDHKLALLNDLDKLFKGKKFVEFVAATRLKYVSLEASKRLKEITNGNYGLEVDEDGRFFIRDYKNGGAERDASTLSGGETFLASLALALALSAEIQLKGTAPLELFFLDEGFGTLDDNLLEVVMSSLEKIHNDKLKIGLISHVETIKNRVPVKLIVTPAESGMGGSKVKIERS